MIYAGNRPESEAVNYKDRVYTHSTWHKGREVRWFDCFSSEDEHKPAFSDELQVWKIRQVDKYFRSETTDDDDTFEIL